MTEYLETAIMAVLIAVGFAFCVDAWWNSRKATQRLNRVLDEIEHERALQSAWREAEAERHPK